MAGTNLNSATSGYNPTLWIETVEPKPSGTGDIALALTACCTGTPPTTANVFAHGCLITQLDTATSTSALFENTGSPSSVVWTSLATSAPGTIALTNTHILVGNASNVATDVAASGDLTLANTGAFTIANNAITTAKINAAAVTGAKLVTAVGYFSVAQVTNGTTPVNVIAATVPFTATITGVYLISNDTTAGNITVADTAGTVATIAKGTSAGVMVGAISLANTTVTSGNTLTIVSSSAGNATVFITFTVA
jgi:hypothetical protein